MTGPGGRSADPVPPRVTGAQLVPLVERAVDKAENGRRPVVLVHADPDAVPQVGDVRGRAVTIHGSRSPLQIRSLLRAEEEGALVVLTDCEPTTLGDDVLARVSGHRVRHIDRWATVCDLFGADRPSPGLVRKAHLADALIEAAPVDGYPRLAIRVLDLDTATAALLRVSIGIADDVTDLAGLLRWLGHADAVGRVANARDDLLADLEPGLRARFGDGVDAVLAALAAGRAGDLVPLGIVAGTVHTPPADDVAAIVRLDERLGGAGLTGDACRAWGAAAEALVREVDDPGRAAGWLDRAGVLLADLGAAHLAHRSDLLPAGFEQRLRAAAEALTRGVDVDAHVAIERTASHDGARHARERVDRLRMAARLRRRASHALTGLDDLASAATAYEYDGAWLDAARTVVSRGDTDPVFSALCASITAEADQARATDGLRFARLAASAGDAVPAPHLGVEDVLDRVVAPLAAVRPVLLVVLDGMGWPTFTELLGALEGAGWSPWRRPNGRDASQVAVAALPTVTEVSRTSLLAGRLRSGDDSSERRAFAAHAGLLTVTGAGPAPQLFHKRDLRVGGLDTLPDGLLDAVADDRRKIVGAVLNNIDERLKDVAQPGDGWELRDLDPLRHVLDEARRAGRAVVMTADHGHVLDRNAEVRTGGGGGERWRPAEPPAGDGEVLVQGRRVVTDDHRAVLPWQEQLRYGPRRNGYHGGLTPKELFVPLVILTTEDLPAGSGWAPGGFRRPAWWHHTQLRPAAPAPVAPVPAAAPTLFDPPAPPSTAWIDSLLASSLLLERRANPRVRLGDPELRRLLSVVDAAGTMAIPLARLATEAELPAARIDRYVAQLQELLNVDGYGVVTTAGNEVRFDRALLNRQFSL
ncbi:MAG: BREX-2 system phosphatase PglZ [Actinomycetota bacterium]|nr:BREX-2 system phosphatase PglZ [Actinomycetota bacterium]